jgi:hypothetical protein
LAATAAILRVTMANKSALETLIELAQRESDDRAKRLGAA